MVSIFRCNVESRSIPGGHGSNNVDGANVWFRKVLRFWSESYYPTNLANTYPRSVYSIRLSLPVVLPHGCLQFLELQPGSGKRSFEPWHLGMKPAMHIACFWHSRSRRNALLAFSFHAWTDLPEYTPIVQAFVLSMLFFSCPGFSLSWINHISWLVTIGTININT